MPFQKKPDDRRQLYLGLVGSIESQIRDAYAKRFEAGEETQASIAKKLDVNRSAINHRLNGRTNMTVKTIADMCWALGHDIRVDIFDARDRRQSNNDLLASDPDVRAPLSDTSTETATGGQTLEPVNLRSASGELLDAGD